MDFLVGLIVAIFSFLPTITILRFFVVPAGGRYRDVRSGQFVGVRLVKTLSLLIGILVSYGINPVLSTFIESACSSNPASTPIFLIVGLAFYYFLTP